MKKESETNKKSPLQLFLTGFGMGSADIVPGVSGGTIAFIFGIYEDLINSIKSVTGKTLQLALKFKLKEAFASIPWMFLLPVFAGIFTALLSLARGIDYLLNHQPVYIWSFFFGLVIASIFLVSKRITKWNTKNIIAITISSFVGFLIVGMVPAETPANPIAFLLSGALAICAMILPGVSGSFLLIILGKYEQILQAVLDKDIITLGIFMIGAILGLSLFSRLLSFLFKNYHNLTVSILTGFMIGSLRKIWPFKQTLETYIDRHGETIPLVQANILPSTLNSEVIIALLLAISAAVFMFYLSKFEKENK